MKRSFVLAGALLGVALITGSVTQGSPELSGPGTIRITSRDIAVSVDNRGAARRDAGDVILVRQLLFNKAIRQAPIGHSDLVCTFTGSKARQCSGTYFLPRGKIVVVGSMRYREFYKLAVVGGTDIYDNVRGSFSATRYASKPTREILVFRLTV
jgi:hypothetical protein